MGARVPDVTMMDRSPLEETNFIAREAEKHQYLSFTLSSFFSTYSKNFLDASLADVFSIDWPGATSKESVKTREIKIAKSASFVPRSAQIPEFFPA